jgi:hypothetical protein
MFLWFYTEKKTRKSPELNPFYLYFTNVGPGRQYEKGTHILSPRAISSKRGVGHRIPKEAGDAVLWL